MGEDAEKIAELMGDTIYPDGGEVYSALRNRELSASLLMQKQDNSGAEAFEKAYTAVSRETYSGVQADTARTA